MYKVAKPLFEMLTGYIGKYSEDFIGMSLATCVGDAMLGNRRTGY